MAKLWFFILIFLWTGLKAFSQEEVMEELEYHNYPTKIPEKLSLKRLRRYEDKWEFSFLQRIPSFKNLKPKKVFISRFLLSLV